MDLIGELTRRRLLQSAGYGVAVSSIALLATPADAIGATQRTVAAPEELAERQVSSRPRMTISLPARIENLQSVPVTVAIERGNAEELSVDSIYLLADGAPSPELARFYPLVKGATVTVQAHVSLGQSRRIWAVARLSDSSVCMATAELAA